RSGFKSNIRMSSKYHIIPIPSFHSCVMAGWRCLWKMYGADLPFSTIIHDNHKRSIIRIMLLPLEFKQQLPIEFLLPVLDEDHIKALRERSRVDLTSFNIVTPLRIVDGERSPQIGGLVRNLVAAQRIGDIEIESIFKKGKKKAAERVLDMFQLVSQATGEAQQLRKQNINFRSNQFSYNRSPVSAALGPKNKKAWKENKSISMNTSRCLSRKGGSSRSPSARGRSFQRGRRSRGSNNSFK
ncbi:MAG: hypothetical protein EZS28_053429, partial [Streblomastix strix]